MEAVIRLAKLLSCGNFTKEDDALILAWVDQHGPVKWRKLARSIGRNYPNAGVSVKARHRLLKENTQKGMKGKIEDKDLETLIRLVLAQNSDALEDIHPRNIDWVKAASDMGRSRDAVYNFYMTQVCRIKLKMKLILDFWHVLYRFILLYDVILQARLIRMLGET